MQPSSPFFCFGLCGFTPTELHFGKKNQSKTIKTMKFHMTSNSVISHQFRLVKEMGFWFATVGKSLKSVG
jgi:hypothetical protein